MGWSKHILRALAIVVGAALLAGCMSSPPSARVPAGEAGAATAAYALDAGDRMRIVVFGQDTLTGEYAVDGTGTISVPLIGTIEARGRSSAELEGVIARRLVERNILVNPSVSVQLVSARPFYVLGEVRSPGQFPYVDGMTVLTAVAISGGFTYRANESSFTVSRRTGDKVQELRADRNTILKPGDVVTVHERFF